MVAISRYRIDWSGFSGAPGISTFYAFGGPPTLDLNPALHTLFNALNTWLPTTVTLSFRTTVDVLDDATGVLTGAGTASTQSNVTGFASGAYEAPSGFAVKWMTASIVHGHRVRGRTFFVPGATAVSNSTGQVGSGVITSVNAACNTFMTTVGGVFGIWARPVYTKPVGGGPGVLTRPGQLVQATAGVCMPQIVVLRKRRD